MKVEKPEEQSSPIYKEVKTSEYKNSWENDKKILVAMADKKASAIKEETIKEDAKYKNLVEKFGEDIARAHTKIALYIDQLAQTKTRAEVTQEEKEFIVNFQAISQSLHIDYQLPPFKESHEIGSVGTMASIYNNTYTFVQDRKYGFQNHMQNSATTNKEISTYKKDKLKDQDFLKLYPKRKEREQEFRNMLKIRHNTIEDPNPSYLADVGQAMNRLANFCKKIQIKGDDYNAFINGSTDTIIKEKIIALSQEMGSLNPIQRGKAFADLTGTTTEGRFVQNGKLQAKDIDNLVTMCEQHQSIDNADGLEYLKNSIYDTSLDNALTT